MIVVVVDCPVINYCFIIQGVMPGAAAAQFQARFTKSEKVTVFAS